jgi:Catalase
MDHDSAFGKIMLPDCVWAVMSDRDIPKSRHTQGFGSHTFSMLNAANERTIRSTSLVLAVTGAAHPRARGPR